VTQTLLHTGPPQALQALDQRALLTFGAQSGGVVEIVFAIGDTLIQGTVVLRALGGGQPVEKKPARTPLRQGAKGPLSRIRNTLSAF